MTKTQELNNPLSCINRARPNEMVFVLLARDLAAAQTIIFWCAERVRVGKNNPDDPEILEALSVASIMKKQWHYKTL